MKAAGRREAKASLDMLEEAVHLVRSAPAAALASYYVGAVPFVLGFLFFWADMSRSPFAERHVTESALWLGGLFVWLKFWQALFLSGLRVRLSGITPVLSGRKCWRIFLSQAVLQPTGLFLLPLGLAPVLPWPWLYAFYQNLTALADGEDAELGPLVKRAARQAGLWPRQNWVLLLVLGAFGLFVFVNWAAVCFLLPGLFKMLLGIESIFARSSWSLLNSTFFTAMLGLTYLCVDPIIKAVYVLRCFYGQSLESGEDLKAELGRWTVRGNAVPVMVALLLVLSPTGLAGASAAGSAVPSQRAFTAAQLDQAIREVAQRPKYAWRMPRDKTPELDLPDTNILERFLTQVREVLGRGLKAVGRAVEWVLRKLFSGRRLAQTGTSTGYGWMMLLQVLLYALAAAVLVGLALLLFRLWRERHRPITAIASQPVQPAPDLNDENLGAEQLPEDGWSRLGGELLAKGELRLALRAFYLSSLAHLAGRNLVTLARFKSNRDYERELCRRGHAFPTVLGLFTENLAAFEPVWYGSRPVALEQVNLFAAKVERIRNEEATV